jgi:DNA modification methylase
LTNEGEVVLDPFAGSNSTGYASEQLKRKWLGIELNYQYVIGSKYRFDDTQDAQINFNNTSEDNSDDTDTDNDNDD